MAETFKTADLCDAHEGQIQICEPIFLSFGGRRRFAGTIATIKCFEDNSLVREMVDEPGSGRVLVVDAGGSMRCAMLGDLLAARAVANGWEGILMNGLIRDSADIAEMDIGVKALGTHPRKSVKRGVGESGVAVRFAGVDFMPGSHLYADEDGIIVGEKDLR